MIQYIKSKDNKNIKYFRKLIVSAKFRKKEKCFIAEGFRLCMDAVKSKTDVLKVFISEQMLSQFDAVDDISKEIYVIPDYLFSHISDTDSPQGIAFVCRCDETYNNIYESDDLLCLDNVKDPINMGNIFRTAEALGLERIAVSNDSCDPFSPKVVRGSMGAVFRLKIKLIENMHNFLCEAHKHGFVTYASVPNGAENILNIDFSGKKNLLIVGNEANGISDEVIKMCDSRITIPMNGRAESLNVASSVAIMLWEMMKYKL